jgi:predicted phosphodiesterase
VRWAVLSDVHGNLLALESCLARIEDLACQRVLCLGDTFGYYPDGVACHELLSSLPAEMLMGNHEAMLLGLLPIPESARDVYRLDEVVSDEVRAALATTLPWRVDDLPRGKRALLVHGTPYDPLEGYAYPDSDLPFLGQLGYDVVLMGNTHRPFVATSGQTIVANVGSVGLPRDSGDLGSFAVLDTESLDVEINRFPLDATAIRTRYAQVHPAVLQVLERRP